jgi:histidinol phosphatase-like enzyme (inositol monophosphatase family)
VADANHPVPPADPALLDEAVDLATRAGELTLRWFRSPDLVVDRKANLTPVTAADRAAERVRREELAGRHPDDEVVGEEEPPTPGTSGRRWVIDPIDGTKAFTHGVPLYCTLLAVDDEHGPAVGVIRMPALRETVYAGRGLGCFCDGAPARVSDRDRLEGSYLTASGYDHWDEALLLAAKRSGMQLRTWGDGYGYALVATGRAEAMCDPVTAVWDVAPMLVVVPEAGGRFTDMAGRATADGGSGLATNGRLHGDVMAALGLAGPDGGGGSGGS